MPDSARPFAARGGLLPSVVEAIGATPLVALDRLTAAAGVEGRVLAKLDYLNPGFSKKDRAALWVIDEAARSGALAPRQPRPSQRRPAASELEPQRRPASITGSQPEHTAHVRPGPTGGFHLLLARTRRNQPRMGKQIPPACHQ